HTILRSQQLEYTVYVAEQVANVTFNKGSVMNAGFLEAFTTTNAQCFVFHDVDMLAEDDRNMYSCPPRPRHLSVGVNTLQYRLPYFLLVGGVLAVRGDHFLKANGYSNMYWGWGGEDD
ncbi:Galactosyltransferase N-terminal, partial [Trinorchestia longiramus]